MAIWSLGCSAQRALPRAIVEPEQVERAVKVQAELDGRSDSPPPDGNWFEERRGASPVVLTAPHATQVVRDGKPRMSDGGGTGALVVALQESVDPIVLYTTWMAPSDPNYADDNDFKLALARVLTSARVCVVLDIHGSHPFRPYDVDLGTLNGDSLLGREWYEEQLREELRTAGLAVLSGNRFAAKTNATITKYSSKLYGIPAIQLEISATLLNPAGGPLEGHRFAQLLEALTRFVKHVNTEFATSGRCP